jgi:hypothetical protein
MRLCLRAQFGAVEFLLDLMKGVIADFFRAAQL